MALIRANLSQAGHVTIGATGGHQMNGPGHYAEAERLAALAEPMAMTDKPRDRENADLYAALALAHAMLANAAATALSRAPGGAPGTVAENEAWRDVADTPFR
jgi:hypothetical protein